MRLLICSAAIASFIAPAAGATPAQAGEVNVYTYRESKLIQPLFDASPRRPASRSMSFPRAPASSSGSRAEGTNSPADVLLTVDIGTAGGRGAGRDHAARSSRSLDNGGTGALPRSGRTLVRHLDARARLYASKERVKQSAITYEELADPKWKGKICIRSGQHIYNNALFAAVRRQARMPQSRGVAQGTSRQSGAEPSGGDRETARDVASGKCDLGYRQYVLLGADERQGSRQERPGPTPPRCSYQPSGAAARTSTCRAVVLAKNAPNKKPMPMKLIEWLVGDKAQHMYADLNYEYPVRQVSRSTRRSPAMARSMPIRCRFRIAEHKKTAANLVDKVGFDH